MMRNDENEAPRPNLRFPEFREGAGWETKRLDEITPSIFDGTHQTPIYTLEGVPFYSVENLISGNANKFISRDDYLVATKKNRPEKGDILLTRIGKIGYSQIVTWDHEFSVYVTLAVIKKSNSYSSHYLHYFIQSKFYQVELLSKSLPNAVPPKINLDSLRATKVLLAKQDEQKRIADCLMSLDEVIFAQVRKVEALKAHKKGLMQRLFPREGEILPRHRFREFRDDASDFKKISEFAKVTTGNQDTQNKIDAGKYPFFVRSQNVERIDKFLYDGEGVLTSGDGVGVGENYHYINGKFNFHQRVYCIYAFNSEVSSKYFFLYFSEHFKRRVKQLSAKNSVDSVRMPMVTEMPIWLPSFEEQRAIASCLFFLGDQITAENEKLDTLRTHKKGLMQQLFPSPVEVDA